VSLVTIISDASYCSRTKCAGYGFWAVSERGRHAGGGSFKTSVSDQNAAEAMAIVNALHVSLSLGITQGGDRVLIQTDSLSAIWRLSCTKKGRRRMPPDAKLAVVRFTDLVRERSLTIEFRHVKAHTKVADQRSKAQRHADARARVGMKKARAKVTP
jgi:ribonuclease HI